MIINNTTYRLYLAENKLSRYRLTKQRKDFYSYKKLVDLKKMISDEVYCQISAFFATEKDQAATIRWILRGLTPNEAIRKIQERYKGI